MVIGNSCDAPAEIKIIPYPLKCKLKGIIEPTSYDQTRRTGCKILVPYAIGKSLKNEKLSQLL